MCEGCENEDLRDEFIKLKTFVWQRLIAGNCKFGADGVCRTESDVEACHCTESNCTDTEWRLR